MLTWHDDPKLDHEAYADLGDLHCRVFRSALWKKEAHAYHFAVFRAIAHGRPASPGSLDTHTDRTQAGAAAVLALIPHPDSGTLPNCGDCASRDEARKLAQSVVDAYLAKAKAA